MAKPPAPRGALFFQRWLRRQAVAEGERLDRLRTRFWRDAAIGRLERVLVAEAEISPGSDRLGPAVDEAGSEVRADDTPLWPRDRARLPDVFSRLQRGHVHLAWQVGFVGQGGGATGHGHAAGQHLLDHR